MRQSLRQQLPVVQYHLDHEHAKELQTMSDLLDRAPEVVDLVHADLVAGLRNPAVGRQALSAEQVLRAVIIKQMNQFSYLQLAFHLADSQSYRIFCRLGLGDDAPSKSALQRDIKKLQPETLEAINRAVVTLAAQLGIERGRKVRVDCTVVESNIHTPTDSLLLWDCVRVLSRLTQQAKEKFGAAVSDHRRRAKRRSLAIMNAKNAAARRALYRDLLKVTRKTVEDAERVASELKSLGISDIITATCLVLQLRHYLPFARQVIDQTERRVLQGESLAPDEKLVSIFEPHTDIIRKDRRDTYYGHKIALTGGASGLVTDLVVEEGNPADSTLAVPMVRRHEAIFGQVPRQASFDGGFASQHNLETIKVMGVDDVVFAKKRSLEISEMAKSAWVYRQLRNFRAGVEGTISFLKRCFGLNRCSWQGFASFKAYVWSSVVAANLLVMARHLLA